MPNARQNARQRRAYNRIGEIWRAIRSAPDPDTLDVGYANWQKIASGVPYHRESAERFNEFYEGIGRTMHPSRRNPDKLHFVYGQDIRDGDLIVDRSTVHGKRDVEYGQGWQTFGGTKSVPDAGTRHANKQSFMAAHQEKLPEGVG